MRSTTANASALERSSAPNLGDHNAIDNAMQFGIDIFRPTTYEQPGEQPGDAGEEAIPTRHRHDYCCCNKKRSHRHNIKTCAHWTCLGIAIGALFFFILLIALAADIGHSANLLNQFLSDGHCPSEVYSDTLNETFRRVAPTCLLIDVDDQDIEVKERSKEVTIPFLGKKIIPVGAALSGLLVLSIKNFYSFNILAQVPEIIPVYYKSSEVGNVAFTDCAHPDGCEVTGKALTQFNLTLNGDVRSSAAVSFLAGISRGSTTLTANTMINASVQLEFPRGSVALSLQLHCNIKILWGGLVPPKPKDIQTDCTTSNRKLEAGPVITTGLYIGGLTILFVLLVSLYSCWFLRQKGTKKRRVEAQSRATVNMRNFARRFPSSVARITRDEENSNALTNDDVDANVSCTPASTSASKEDTEEGGICDPPLALRTTRASI